jgi:hypothetical protein
MFLTVCFCNYIVTIYISYLYLLVFLLSAGHVMVLRLFSQCFAVSLKCILLLVLFDLHHTFITFGSIKYHVFLSNFCMVVVSLTIVKPSGSYLNHRVLWFYNYNQQDPSIFLLFISKRQFHLTHDTSLQQYWLTIPEAEGTVMCSWWWAEDPPETRRAF